MLCYRFFKKAYSPNPSIRDQAPLWEKKMAKNGTKRQKNSASKGSRAVYTPPFPLPIPQTPAWLVSLADFFRCW